MSNRKLGRGLDALIPRTPEQEEGASGPSNDPGRFRESPAPSPSERSPADATIPTRLPIHSIAVNRAQPRQAFDEEALAELTASVRTNGILQPLVVRQVGDSFELVAGERRLRAAKEAGLEEVPVVLRDAPTDAMLELALVENIQREDLNPVELAQAYQSLQQNHQWTQQQLADRLGKKRSSIANALRVLELPEPALQALAAGQISSGHAKVLLSLPDPNARLQRYRETVSENLSVRELEQRIAPRSGAKKAPPTRAQSEPDAGNRTEVEKDPAVVEQEQILSRNLGTKVEIRPGKGGNGRIVLSYFSPSDFGRLSRRLLRGPESPGVKADDGNES